MHHIASPDTYLHALRRIVKPRGRVAVIDYRDAWPDGHESMKYTEAQLDSWMRDAGFGRLEAHDFLDGLFFVVYR
ncbi:MAG: hypothetical protein A2W29_14025 [Gemmatimonadetes bacterium RBG_16_66_8]|nr:MAG: hypothetical protein A2W29_14025 [Gemmatimonadetes bacterium RBG_16_66_8]